MTYTEEEKRAAAREALDWCAERHGTLSAFAREQGRDLESLKMCLVKRKWAKGSRTKSWTLSARSVNVQQSGKAEPPVPVPHYRLYGPLAPPAEEED